MTYAADETGVETSRPRELYTFVAGATTYRYTSAAVDVSYSGDVYTAIPIQRSPVATVGHDDQPQLTIEFPASSTLAQAIAFDIPSQTITVTVLRLQLTSGVAIRLWDGAIAAIDVSGRTIKVTVPTALDNPLRTNVPGVSLQRTCNHALYGARLTSSSGACTVARASFKVDTTLVSTSGHLVTVASIGGHPDDWARSGEVVIGGERRTILSQTGAVLKVFAPFASDIVSGTPAVTVYAGCDHRATTCRDKFSNVLNFGGAPFLKYRNPFVSRLGWR